MEIAVTEESEWWRLGAHQRIHVSGCATPVTVRVTVPNNPSALRDVAVSAHAPSPGRS